MAELTINTSDIAASLQKNLAELKGLSPKELVATRYEKFRKMALYFTEG